MWYELRSVSESDKDILFEWVNDDVCRFNSFHSNKIDYKEHSKWFDEKIKSDMCDIYIYYCDGCLWVKSEWIIRII